MGIHFQRHAQELGINLMTEMDKIMQHCELTVIASVEPGVPGSRGRLDRLEASLMNRMMTMERHGGMNVRDDIRRGRGPGQ